MSLRDLVNKARSWLGAATDVPRELQEHAVRQTRWDTATYDEMLGEVPELARLVESLNQDYDYTKDLVADTFASFYQSAPLLHERSQMKEGWLANHAVAADVAKAPDTPLLRSYAQHDRYGAAMATLGVSEKVRGYLRQHKELAEAAKVAEEARQQAREAAQQAEQAAQQGQAAADGLDQANKGLDEAVAAQAAAQAAADAAMGEFDGNGPLTAEQAAAQAAAQQAGQQAGQAQADAQAAGLTAEQTQQMLEHLLAQAEAARQAAEQAGQQVQDEAVRTQRALAGQVSQAVTQAAEDLAQQEEMFSAWGVEDGEVQQMSFQDRQALAQRLSGHSLAEYVKHLGRWAMMQKAHYAHNVNHARDEVYDVELTGRLDDVVPAEFAALGHPVTTIEFLVRLDERQLLGRKFRGTERSGQGAIIACVDTSGSMKKKDSHGVPRDVFGKGFALALLAQARAEKRDFVCVVFANAGKQRVFRFPKGQASLDEVLAMTELFFDGGTDFQKPIDLAIEVLQEEFDRDGRAKGDLVLITDDDCRVSPEWLQSYADRKSKLKFRMFGVAVGMPHPGGTLIQLSDDVRAVQEFFDPSVVADVIRTI